MSEDTTPTSVPDATSDTPEIPSGQVPVEPAPSEAGLAEAIA